MCNKESQIYVLYQNGEMVISESNDDNEHYYIQSHDYAKYLANDTNLYYSKIPIIKNNSKFYINEINDQIENVHKKIIDLKNSNKQIELNQVSQINDNITNLKTSLKYLHKISQNSNIGNIKDIYDIKSQLNTFIDFDLNNHKHLSQALNTLSQQIEQLIEIINYLVNFINALTVTHLKIFEIIYSAVDLINFTLLKQIEDTNLKIKSSTMKCILIDQNQNPVLVFEEDSSNTNKNSKSNIEIEKEAKENFKSILNQYYQNEEQIFARMKTDEENTNGIDEYFMNEVEKFKNELSEILNKSQEISQMKIELDEFKNKFNNIVKEKPINDEIYKDQTKSDFYWLYFLNIFKLHVPYDPSIVYKMINSLFGFYFENVGNEPIQNSFEKLISVFGNCKTSDKSNPKIIQDIIKEIQKTNNYFYFDVLNQIFIRNILNHQLFESKYQKESMMENNDYEEDNDHSNKYKLIKDCTFGTEITTSKFVYDNKTFNFFLEVDYKTEITEVQKYLRNREIEIYNTDYSKFIIRYIYKISESRIVIPYFTNRTLDTVLHPINKKRRIKLTFVDKIVIIYEIALGLNDLYFNNQYHGNLASTMIYINSKNDAYIGGFSYDKNIENNATRPNGPFYYHPPEILNSINIVKTNGNKIVKTNDNKIVNSNDNKIEKSNDNKIDQSNDNNNIEKVLLNDIFSFGVLIHEIITETDIQARFGNMEREKRYKLLKEEYFEYLMSGINNDYFKEDSYLIDQNGNSMIGMKEIIEKCMKNDSSQRFQSFKEIINCIKKTPIYLKNKDEIEYRVNNADKSLDIRCSFADLVEAFYKGQDDCLTDISNVLETYCLIASKNKDDLKSEDIIKKIFEAFDMQNDNNEDFSFFFTDIFNHIIQMNSKSKIDETKIVDYRDKLFDLSKNANLKQSLKKEKEKEIEQINDFIIPISSFENFINHNKDQISNLIPTWIYILAYELQYIHSKKFCHGSLSPKNIGIYYNNETQTFIPSIILFYSFYKRIPNNQQDQRYFKQKKDIKQFKNILNFFYNITNNQFINTIQEKIKYLTSINSIVNFLYDFIIENCNQEQKNLLHKNLPTEDYSSFQITYPIMIKIFYKMGNVYSFQDLFFDFGTIFNNIIIFLNNTNFDSSKSIIENIPKETKSSNITKYDDIWQLLNTIKAKCSLIWDSIISKISSAVADEFPEIIKTEGNKIMICGSNIDLLKKNENEKMMKSLPSFHIIFRNKEPEEKKWFNRFVQRKIEIIELYLKSVEFLIRRYIYSLNPTINYKLSVKISNRDYSDYQDVQIKFDHIKAIVDKLGFNDVINENGCVVVSIKKLIE